eukprot:6185243-Pleurochrysis_carterae.AAC.6
MACVRPCEVDRRVRKLRPQALLWIDSVGVRFDARRLTMQQERSWLSCCLLWGTSSKRAFTRTTCSTRRRLARQCYRCSRLFAEVSFGVTSLALALVGNVQSDNGHQLLMPTCGKLCFVNGSVLLQALNVSASPPSKGAARMYGSTIAPAFQDPDSDAEKKNPKVCANLSQCSHFKALDAKHFFSITGVSRISRCPTYCPQLTNGLNIHLRCRCAGGFSSQQIGASPDDLVRLRGLLKEMHTRFQGSARNGRGSRSRDSPALAGN